MEEKCHDPIFKEKMQTNLTNKIFTFWEVNMDIWKYGKAVMTSFLRSNDEDTEIFKIMFHTLILKYKIFKKWTLLPKSALSWQFTIPKVIFLIYLGSKIGDCS